MIIRETSAKNSVSKESEDIKKKQKEILELKKYNNKNNKKPSDWPQQHNGGDRGKSQ